MKKTLRIVALMLVLVMSVCALASCGALSGEYKSVAGNSYEFSGKKYTYNAIISVNDQAGTYEIDEDAGEIIFTPDEGDSYSLSFSKGEEDGVKYIKIGGVKYNEVK